MAKVFCVGFLMINGDREVNFFLTLGYLEFHTGLSLGVFLNPFFYQRTCEARSLYRAYIIISTIFLCPDVAQSEAQKQCYCKCYPFHLLTL